MTRFGCSLRALVCVVLVAKVSVLVQAQETTGNISGTITDSSGASVKGAAMTLTNPDRGLFMISKPPESLITPPLGSLLSKSLDACCVCFSDTAGVNHNELVLTKRMRGLTP